MPKAIRQENLYGAEDWSIVYSSFKNAEFISYDFDTLRQSMVIYMQTNYPEEYNDYIQNSEFIALLDLVAYVGQNLAFRMDLNARENILDTAEKRESVLRIARMLSYKPKRVRPAQGFLKVVSAVSSDQIIDSTGINLSNKTIQWGSDPSELEYERFVRVMNAAFNDNNKFGNPVKRATNGTNGTMYEIYNFNNTNSIVNFPIPSIVDGFSLNFDLVPVDIDTAGIISQVEPDYNNSFSVMYRNDGKGVGSTKTGFFFLAKQGYISSTIQTMTSPVANAVIDIPMTDNVSEEDFYVQTLDDNGSVIKTWSRVSNLDFSNIVVNEYGSANKDLYEVLYSDADITSIKFGDGTFTNVPTGNIRIWYRTAENNFIRVKSGEISNVTFDITYRNAANQTHVLSLTMELQDNMVTGLPSESIDEIKRNAPEAFYSKNRMVTADDYNGFLPTLNNDVLVLKAENRTFSGHSRYVDLKDPTGKNRPLMEFADDGYLYREESVTNTFVPDDSTRRTVDFLDEYIESKLSNVGLLNFYYGKLNLTSVAGDAALNYFPTVNLGKTIYYTTLTNTIGKDDIFNTLTVDHANTDDPYDNFDIDGGMLMINNELFSYSRLTGNNFSISGTLLRNVRIIGTTGQFSCNSATLIQNQIVTVTGGRFLSGSIANYNNSYKKYYIIETNGSTTFRLSETLSGPPVNTTESSGAIYSTPTFIGVQREFQSPENSTSARHAAGSRVYKVLDYRWRVAYNDANSSNGYISESYTNPTPVKLGFTTGGELRSLRPGSIIRLQTIDGVNRWVNVYDIKGDGLGIENIDYSYTGLLVNGMGTVEISKSITSKDLIKEILPPFTRIFDDITRAIIIDRLNAGNSSDFALKFDNLTPRWIIIDKTVDLESEWNRTSDDNEWLIALTRDGAGWKITIRQLDYIFGSDELIRFYNINWTPTFNNSFKSISKDKITLLDMDTNNKIKESKSYRISGYYVYDDGYTDNSKIKVTPLDLDNDFLPDDPEHFISLVRDSRLNLINYDEGDFSYLVPVEVSTPESVVKVVPGINSVPFKWEHYVDIDQSLDPSLTNIIDVYVLTKSYNDDYTSWKKIGDKNISAPLPQTSEELRNSFAGLLSYKMMTDEIIFHPVKFKPLFGNLAEKEFQAQFKVVKNSKSKLTDSEIKSKVITAIDNFFTPGNFNFGEIFYFTELAAYIHTSLSSDLSSVVIVPISQDSKFGTLFQIQPDRNEVVTSVATVNDIIVISEITDSNIRIGR